MFFTKYVDNSGEIDENWKYNVCFSSVKSFLEREYEEGKTYKAIKIACIFPSWKLDFDKNTYKTYIELLDRIGMNQVSKAEFKQDEFLKRQLANGFSEFYDERGTENKITIDSIQFEFDLSEYSLPEIVVITAHYRNIIENYPKFFLSLEHYFYPVLATPIDPIALYKEWYKWSCKNADLYYHFEHTPISSSFEFKEGHTPNDYRKVSKELGFPSVKESLEKIEEVCFFGSYNIAAG